MSDDQLALLATCAFPGFTLEVNEALPLEGCTAVFGPSGSGKSTLLRLIAGFQKPTTGHVYCAGTPWSDAGRRLHIPPDKREVGYLFQDGRLFPHLSVMGNLAFADTRSRATSGAITFDGVVSAFDLKPLLDRHPESLSGGERQRVALARTLLTRPRLLLLDEPLSALDRARKREILPYLEALPHRFGVPTIYVSHAVEEVVRLADRILILADGKTVAHGDVTETLNAFGYDVDAEAGTRPAVILEGRCVDPYCANGLAVISVGSARLSLPARPGLAAKYTVRMRIDARDVAISLTEPVGLSIRNVLPATIRALHPIPGQPFVDIELDSEGAPLFARITQDAVAELSLTPGQRVFALIKTASFD
ncbi:MAG: molybdenum ABC transporter ATP-binding protein [Pseudomonadota bacterium]